MKRAIKKQTEGRDFPMSAASSILSCEPDVNALVGMPADIAPSAYHYRADREAAENPPETWFLLTQHADLPLTRPVAIDAPAIKQVLCGLLWEEVRPVRRLELVWPAGSGSIPSADEVIVTYFDSADKNAHVWFNLELADTTVTSYGQKFNPLVKKEAGKPEVAADGRTYVYGLPVDTWAVVVSVRDSRNAATFAVPALRAFGEAVWKAVDLEIEWGFEPGRADLQYDGRLESYNGVLADLHPLDGDAGTTMTSPLTWRSPGKGQVRRGIRGRLLYIGTSTIPPVWPYIAPEAEVARTLVTVWTESGSFTFRASDLELGPILAPEYGFFVRASASGASGQTAAVSQAAARHPFYGDSRATTAAEFLKELAVKGLSTVRRRVRLHPEQTWEGAVAAMYPRQELPPHPQPEFEPAMQVQVPSERLNAQWRLGAWHILRGAERNAQNRYCFKDPPFGILAAETYLILHALDLQGLHQETADGLDQWLSLPQEQTITAGANHGGHHEFALPDRPLGNFADGKGCLTHAVGPTGSGGHMDGVHSMGPGAIMYALSEHALLTGDCEWLKAAAPRMKANAEWILRQRRLLATNIPGGRRLWAAGLQPGHVVTPDSECMVMQFYETEAYYWLGVKRLAELLARIDSAEGSRLAAEAEAYRQDLVAAIERSIALTPVVPVRDGTYHSFIPFAPYVRGFATGAWGWRRCGGHVGALYWDTVQSSDPLLSPAAVLPPDDPRVQGHLDVLEDRLLLENEKVSVRTPGFDPEKHWFAHASWQYQCGLERHANIHLAADDAPNFIRSWLNQYAVDILPRHEADGPAQYTFREHTTGGPPDKTFEEAAFLERFRNLLVMEDGGNLWLARATPRAWLAQGQRISVKHAPTHFGAVDYEIVSGVDQGRITANLNWPSRNTVTEVRLRLRHPWSAPIKSVTVNGKKWKEFNRRQETVRLHDLTGRVTVVACY